MKILTLTLILFIISCGYPDIDSVPTFKNVKMTEEEAIDLCILSNTAKKDIDNCLNSMETYNQ